MRRDRRATFGALWLAATAAAFGFAASACHGWDPLDPFQHDAPEVDHAIGELDGGRYKSAEQILAEYLHTGVCRDGKVGLPDDVKQKPNGSFDLGLSLFHLAEKFGKRFGDEETPEASPTEQPEARAAEVACALVIAKAIAQDSKVPPELRARAFYLAGNLAFMSKDYQEAIKLYDSALGIVPGLPADAGVDGIGRDAAHNRAIALRRLEDQRQDGGGQGDGGDSGSGDGGDAGDGSGDQDASDGGGKGDGGDDGGDDDEGDDQNSSPDAGNKDAGPDAGDAGADPKDKGDTQSPASPQPNGQPEGAQQDDRMLDKLEEAPSYQQQEGRARANRRRGRAMEDK